MLGAESPGSDSILNAVRNIRRAEESRWQSSYSEPDIPDMSDTLENPKSKVTITNCNCNLNTEFGPIKDYNIISTPNGAIVKVGKNWRFYDKNKKKIVNVSYKDVYEIWRKLPVFILPTTKLSEGDLIKVSGEYYFVVESTEKNVLVACVNEKNIGKVIAKDSTYFSYYLKIITFSDFLSVDDELDFEKFNVLSIMCERNEENSNLISQFIPLMLFKEKLDGNDDVIKMMFMASVMNNNNSSTILEMMLKMLSDEKKENHL